MTCGIYSFNCGPYFYVGRSIKIERRWNEHLRGLRNGTHSNPWVRNAFDKHGWTGQDVLVECEPHQNEDNEQHFIDLFYGTEFCMNISNSAEDGGSGMVQVRWARPGSREAASVLQKEVQNRPEVRVKLSAALKAAAARPEVREKRNAALKAAAARPGAAQKRSEASLTAHARPGAKDKHREAVKRDHEKRKIRNFEAELADIPEGGDIISMFGVNHDAARA